MADAGGEVDSDASRAELFDSLGHPLRIRILQALEAGSLGFGDLKRKVGVESNGNLQYHLGRLDGLVRGSADGSYSITDDGREALRMVASAGATQSDASRSKMRSRLKGHRTVVVSLVAVLILASSVAVYQFLIVPSSVSHPGPHYVESEVFNEEHRVNYTQFLNSSNFYGNHPMEPSWLPSGIMLSAIYQFSDVSFALVFSDRNAVVPSKANITFEILRGPPRPTPSQLQLMQQDDPSAIILTFNGNPLVWSEKSHFGTFWDFYFYYMISVSPSIDGVEVGAVIQSMQEMT